VLTVPLARGGERMPYAAPRACSEPGCTAPTHTGRCARHPRTDAHARARAARYAGPAWRLIRTAVLRRDPVCSECHAAPSTTAAHVVARSAGGSDSMDNLRGLCTSCHSRETAARDGGFGNATRHGGRGPRISGQLGVSTARGVPNAHSPKVEAAS